MTEVTDPNILAQLNGTSSSTGPRPVTDPSILAQLNAGDNTSPSAVNPDSDFGSHFEKPPEKKPSTLGDRFKQAVQSEKQVFDTMNPVQGALSAVPHEIVAGTAGVAGKLAGRVADMLPGGADWNPGQERKADTWGQAAQNAVPSISNIGDKVENKISQGASFVGGAVSRAAANIPGVDTPLGHTLAEAGGEALQDAGLLAGGASAASNAFSKFDRLNNSSSTIADFGAQSKNTPIQPQGKAIFEAPQQSSTLTGVPASEIPNRKATLEQLHKDSGQALPEVRTSALTGTPQETATDFAHQKIEDAGGRRMRGVLSNEQDALKSASGKIEDMSGGQAEGTSPQSLQDRGRIIDKGVSSIEDWFDNARKSLYQEADQKAQGVQAGSVEHPFLKGPLEADQMGTTATSKTADMLKENESTGTTGGDALIKGAISRAKRLGIIDQDGNFSGANAKTMESFRQWINETSDHTNWKTANALKGAVDEDMAASGGPNVYAAARALRVQQDKWLEGPKGIRQILNNDDKGNRSIYHENLPDKIANMPFDQFKHITDVLKSAQGLGDASVAENADNALKEIKGHMAARLTEAGSSGRDGIWNPYSYHKQATKYALKMPEVFDTEELGRMQTINKAGNILKIDKSLTNQSVAAHNTKMSMKERVGNALVDEATNLVKIPGTAALAEFTGIGQKARDIFKGNPEAKRLAEVNSRISRLGERATPKPKTPQEQATGWVKQSYDRQSQLKQGNP